MRLCRLMKYVAVAGMDLVTGVNEAPVVLTPATVSYVISVAVKGNDQVVATTTVQLVDIVLVLIGVEFVLTPVAVHLVVARGLVEGVIPAIAYEGLGVGCSGEDSHKQRHQRHYRRSLAHRLSSFLSLEEVSATTLPPCMSLMDTLHGRVSVAHPPNE